ncbi:hypothetical protein ABF55_11060 [Enterobacter asburiae]|nr:hypothetical protein YA44_11055 [Enterobacter asburiae]KLP44547.1 hypothetical protein ABF55_11060 [Enterobacter asburiae]
MISQKFTNAETDFALKEIEGSNLLQYGDIVEPDEFDDKNWKTHFFGIFGVIKTIVLIIR